MNQEFLKIIVILVFGGIFVILIKSNSPEMSFLLSLGISAVAVFLIVKLFYPSAKTLINIYESAVGNRSTIGVLIKAVIISYLSEFCGNTCRDFGLTALAEKAELAGKCAVFILSVPLICSIMDTAIGLTKI